MISGFRKIEQVNNTQKGFTLVEILVAVAVFGLLSMGIYRVTRDMLFSERILTYRSTVDRDLSRFFEGMSMKDYYEEDDPMIDNMVRIEVSFKKDVMSASYPTYIDYNQVVVPWDGSVGSPAALWSLTDNPIQDFTLQYLGGFRNDMVGSGLVCFDQTKLQDDEMLDAEEEDVAAILTTAGNTPIMRFQIHTPEDATVGRSARNWTVELRLRDQWDIMSASGDLRRRRRQVLTYSKIGTEGPEIEETPILENVMYVKFTHRKRYTDAQITEMNTTRAGEVGDPGNDPTAGAGIFPSWANPSWLEIEICIGPDPRFELMVRDHDLRIKAVRRFEPISVEVTPTGAL